MPPRRCGLACLVALRALLVACTLASGVVWAQSDGDAAKREATEAKDRRAIAYKLTPELYLTTNQHSAFDVNLRGNYEEHTAWVGFYRRGDEFQQLRLGYEYSFELPFGHIVPSLQYATRGFLGGSLTAEIGERYFGLIGIGRTNLKDYFNLNFDPNDAITLGVGTRAIPKTTLSLYQVRDDRLGTGQRVIHLVARVKPDARTRWTFDMFYKQGHSPDDGEWVHGTGASATYDFDRYFIRIAADPKVNFSHEDMLRIAFGFRM